MIERKEANELKKIFISTGKIAIVQVIDFWNSRFLSAFGMVFGI